MGSYGSAGSRGIICCCLLLPKWRGGAGHGSLVLGAATVGIRWSKIMDPSTALLQLQLSKHVLPDSNGAPWPTQGAYLALPLS